MCVHISVRLLFIWQNIQRLGFSLGWRNHNTGISLSWWECEVCSEEFTKGQSSLFKHRVVTKISAPWSLMSSSEAIKHFTGSRCLYEVSKRFKEQFSMEDQDKIYLYKFSEPSIHHPSNPSINLIIPNFFLRMYHVLGIFKRYWHCYRSVRVLEKR